MDKTLMTVLLLLGAATIALYNVEGSSAKPYGFEQFKADFGKKYTKAGEEEYRRSIFLRNLVKYAEHNANAKNTYTVGVNQFSDLLDAEFAAIYLTLQTPKHVEVLDEKPIITADIDWVAAGKVTRVKNQASCGSCWAFSATASLESAYLIAGSSTDISEQELVDCSRSYGNQGCNGGWMDSAFEYIRDKGISTTAEYPYTARDQTCAKKSSTYKLTNFVDVPGCTNLANALAARPVSVAVDASIWSPYRSGILSGCGTAVNHGVLLVGVSDTFWKIKNSWGTGWGESGFIRIAPGNTCAVCGYPSYPTL
jgi:C1A family cysteine protease